MSGIEVAGLVLGAFPLLITALEHYRDSAEALKVFWKIKREYKKWVHDLKICELAFERNLEFLLLPLIVDDDEVQGLLRDPGGPGWQDPELEVRLKERLLKSYDLYRESINGIMETIGEIKQELGVDKSSFQTHVSDDATLQTIARSNVSLDSVKTNFSFQTRRIKMSLSKSKREDLFNQLTKGTDQLRDLLDSSDRITSIRQNRSVAKIADTKGMRQFWRHTDKLYKLLTRSWNCECRQLHLANLLLQHRASPTLDFRIFFFFGNSGEATPSWTHQEAKIRILEHYQEDKLRTRSTTVSFAPNPIPLPYPTPATTPVTTLMSSPPTPTALQSSLSMPSSTAKAGSIGEPRSFAGSILGKLKKEKKIGCAEPVSDTLLASLPSITPAPTKTLEQPRLIVTNADDNADPKKAQEGMIDIINLCDEMPKFPAKADGQHFCLKDDHCRIAINPLCHPKPATTSAAARDMISLEALLRKGTPRTLTRRERYLIGLTLASSYLQLKSSPWIHRQWSKRDILFLRNQVSPGGIRVDQPYISRHFEDADNGCGDDDDITIRFDRGDRTLESLGIMLLELCFGTALEEHETRRRYHQMSPGGGVQASADLFLDIAAALEWSSYAAEEAGPEFSDAIGWCLKNMPNSRESGMKLDNWRQELFDKVVLPLKYCHDQFTVMRG